ncbi:efflux RND transporter periplasmic adaptor subunit [Algoriphagus sp. AGSA1]|uniref:efflux RND transporter periplasmic adaptor subunit n=1 Tax=unclassified Algoriphagus TaxID=2641541 RepID=UPI001782E955|nr:MULTISPECIES: efflux RND transporter periplasmic adaptor subunit [unclassified Algoriphagus]MCE7056229.1 efflux RND transporter periplasmic adaptor subunit [Algoriphagus sp. AGSA1]
MKKYILPILYVAIISACSNTAENRSTESKERPTQKAETITLGYENAPYALTLPAELHAFEKAHLNARVQGYVREVLVDIGDQVANGTVLVKIQAPEIDAAYAEAQSEAASARADYMGSKDVFERLMKASGKPGAVSESDLIRAMNKAMADSTRLVAAEHTARAKQQLLDYLTIRAPFNGVITQRTTDPGNLVGGNKEASLLVIENNQRLRLKVPVPEALTGSSLAKDSATFNVESFPGRWFKADYYRRARSIDPGTRTEMWEFIVNNQKGELNAGLFAEVQLNVQRTDESIWVPHSAVLTTLRRKAVGKIVDGKLKWVEVKTGMKSESTIEVFGALGAGDHILLQPNEEMIEGMSIN